MTLQHTASHHATIDVALGIHAKAFGAGVIGGGRFLILNERRDTAILRTADADALLDAGQFVRAGISAP